MPQLNVQVFRIFSCLCMYMFKIIHTAFITITQGLAGTFKYLYNL